MANRKLPKVIDLTAPQPQKHIEPSTAIPSEVRSVTSSSATVASSVTVALATCLGRGHGNESQQQERG